MAESIEWARALTHIGAAEPNLTKVFSTGLVMTIYEPAGEVVPGSFALEEPSEAELERRRKFED